MNRGLLIVISGPSGAGKGTIIEALLKNGGRYHFSVSATTRAPRPGEKDGVAYFFFSRQEFEKKIKDNFFLEWAEVHGCYYGTPMHWVDEKLAAGDDVLLDIDVQGGALVRKQFPEGVFIFIIPPSFSELRRRLEHRHTEQEAAILRRLEDAKEELRHAKEYSYIVVNDVLDEAVGDVQAIIRAEKCKLSRRMEVISHDLSAS